MATASADGCVIDHNPMELGAAIARAIEASGKKGPALREVMGNVLTPITQPMNLGTVVLDVMRMTNELRYSAAAERPEDWAARTAYTGARYHAVYDSFIRGHLEVVGGDSELGDVRREFLEAYAAAARAAGLDPTPRNYSAGQK